MQIRHAKKSDFKTIAAIQIESWKDSYSDVLPADFMDRKINRAIIQHWNEVEIQDGDVILVAEEKTMIGFIAVWCQTIPFIDNLHVRPSMRSKKIGTALMRAVAEELINNGHNSAYLWVFESNGKAIQFYDRLAGKQKEQSIKTVFGFNVPSRKIEWDDLSLILKT
jgi:ribosomal protein S18 acetylase RimI-like enzyme